MKWNLFLKQIIKHKVRIILSLLYLTILPLIFDWLQTYYYCDGIDDPSNCKVWGSYMGVIIIQVLLGSAFVGFIGSLLSRQKISKLLLILSVIIVPLYFFALYSLFVSYLKITSEEIVYNDILNGAHNKIIKYTDVKTLQIEPWHNPEGGYEDKYYFVLKNGTRIGIGIGGNDAITTISKLRNLPIEYTESD